MICPMTEVCLSADTDHNGECRLFASLECRFVANREIRFACDSCVHSLTKHVDPRCKTCNLKDQVAFSARPVAQATA
jgi:hypothetical protein